MINTDLISGILVLFITAFAWYHSRDFSYHGGVFVDCVLLILFVLGVSLSIKGLAKRTPSNFWEEGAHKGSVLGLAGVFICYIAAIPWIGFIAASILTFTVASALLTSSDSLRSPYTWVKSLGVGSIMTAAFYMVFKYALAVPLPAGVLFG